MTEPTAARRARGESPIFIKSYELLIWLLQHTRKFPKDQRFVMARRMEEAVLDLNDALQHAGRARRAPDILRALVVADGHLARLKLYARAATDLRLQSLDQLAHLAKMLEEVGRLLGGWMKSLSTSTAHPSSPPAFRRAAPAEPSAVPRGDGPGAIRRPRSGREWAEPSRMLPEPRIRPTSHDLRERSATTIDEHEHELELGSTEVTRGSGSSRRIFGSIAGVRALASPAAICA